MVQSDLKQLATEKVRNVHKHMHSALSKLGKSIDAADAEGAEDYAQELQMVWNQSFPIHAGCDRRYILSRGYFEAVEALRSEAPNEKPITECDDASRDARDNTCDAITQP